MLKYIMMIILRSEFINFLFELYSNLNTYW